MNSKDFIDTDSVIPVATITVNGETSPNPNFAPWRRQDRQRPLGRNNWGPQSNRNHQTNTYHNNNNRQSRPYLGRCQACGVQGHSAKYCPAFKIICNLLVLLLRCHFQWGWRRWTCVLTLPSTRSCIIIKFTESVEVRRYVHKAKIHRNRVPH